MLIGDEVTTELINKQYGISMCLNETADYYYNYLNNNLSTEQLDELCDMFEPRLQASYELSDVESLMYDTLLIDIVSESYQRYRGSLSGSVVAYLDAKINKAKPEINWFKELSRFVGSTITTKHRLTKAKPNLLVDEYYGKVLLIKKKILVAIDVSGSVSNDELIVFYNQLRFINNTDNIIEVMQFDSDVKVEPILYTNLNVNKIKIHGRGGTDFQPPIDYFNTNKRKYDMCIVFTDGEASTPTKPHKPILFVISSQGTTNYIKSFKHIQINKNGIKQQTN
jgi:predicted metal-dependent peptidase